MVLGISPIYHIAAEPHSLRTGSFTITLSPGKLLGEAAQKVASVIPVDEPISWEGIDKLMSEHDEPPNVDSVMRPLRNSKTQRRAVGKIDSVWPISNAAPD